MKVSGIVFGIEYHRAGTAPEHLNTSLGIVQDDIFRRRVMLRSTMFGISDDWTVLQTPRQTPFGFYVIGEITGDIKVKLSLSAIPKSRLMNSRQKEERKAIFTGKHTANQSLPDVQNISVMNLKILSINQTFLGDAFGTDECGEQSTPVSVQGRDCHGRTSLWHSYRFCWKATVWCSDRRMECVIENLSAEEMTVPIYPAPDTSSLQS
nr:hypothetical protein CFP56_13475 [Quercus suber]